MEGPGADSEEKRVLASDLDTVMVDSLKALDLIRQIREADIAIEFQGWEECRAPDLQRRYSSQRASFKMFVPLCFSEMSQWQPMMLLTGMDMLGTMP